MKLVLVNQLATVQALIPLGPPEDRREYIAIDVEGLAPGGEVIAMRLLFQPEAMAAFLTSLQTATALARSKPPAGGTGPAH